jgi:predicted Zn finger-like uncharacterized protein
MIIPCKSCNAVFRLESSILNPTGSKVRCSKCGEVFKVYPPDYVERRKHQRLKTRNLISHVSYDKAGRLTFQGLSKALDISRKGILLETIEPIESGLLSMMATDVENNLIEIEGNVVYCKESFSGRYRSGIAFIGTDDEVETFVTELINEYSFRKKKSAF